jgi:hypothetical protein
LADCSDTTFLPACRSYGGDNRTTFSGGTRRTGSPWAGDKGEGAMIRRIIDWIIERMFKNNKDWDQW